MAEYVYFVASLPSLRMDRPSPMTYGDFLSKAKEQMSPKDFSELSRATFAHEEGKASYRIVKDWDKFNNTLNELITEERARKLGLGDNQEYKARCGRDAALEKKSREIVGMKNPLDAEKAKLALYFDFLNSHPVENQFSTEALIVYGLKLQIKEKVSAFEHDKGKDEFDSLYSDIQKEITDRSEYGL